MSSITSETLKSIEEVNSGQWDNVVRQSKTGKKKDLSNYWRALENGKRGEPIIFVALKKDNIVGFISGHIQKVFLGQKILRTNTPVTISNEENVLRVLFDNLEDFCIEKDVLYHEMRTIKMEDTRFNGFLEEEGYESKIFSCQHRLDLDQNMQNLIEGMSNSRRKSFRKMKDSDNVQISDPSKEDLINFYEGTKKYQRRPEVPFNTLGFYENLAVIEGIRIASYQSEGEKVAENLYVIDESENTVHYLQSAVYEGYRQKNALEEIHAYAISNFHENYEIYNFGDNEAHFRDGIFKFKQQYGCYLKPVIQWKRIYPSLKNRLLIRAMSSMRGD